MAMTASKLMQIGEQVVAMQPRLAALAADAQYAGPLQLNADLMPYMGVSEEGQPLSIATSFCKDIKLLKEHSASETWFDVSFWTNKIARSTKATLRGVASDAITHILRYTENALKSQKMLAKFLQKTGLEGRHSTAIAHYYFFILGQIVAATNSDHTEARARLNALTAFLRAAMVPRGMPAGERRTLFITHTKDIIGFIHTYLIKLTMISEQQTYADLLDKIQGSAKDSVESVLKSLIAGATAIPIEHELHLPYLVQIDADSFYSKFIKTPMGRLLQGLCLEPNVLPVIDSVHSVDLDHTRSVVFEHLSTDSMRRALMDEGQTFGAVSEQKKWAADPLYPLFAPGEALTSTSYAMGRGNPSIFRGIGESAAAKEFSERMLTASLDMMGRIRDLCEIHKLVNQAIAPAGLVGDTLINGWRFSLLLIGVIEEVCSELAANLLQSCESFYEALKKLPSLLDEKEEQYHRITSNHAALEEIYAKAKFHLIKLQQDAAKLQERTASITAGRVQEAIDSLCALAQDFSGVAGRIDLNTPRLSTLNKLLGQKKKITVAEMPAALAGCAAGASASTPAKSTARASFATINVNGVAHTINIDYEYEDQDVTAILNARLVEWRQTAPALDPLVYVCAPVEHTLSVRELQARLQQDRAANFGKHISLIPCNIGNYHWVGLLFEFNEQNQCIRAEFINSTRSPAPLSLKADLAAVYPGVEFIERFDLIAQYEAGEEGVSPKDWTTCGACMIENMMLSLIGAPKPADSNMFQIRAEQLDLLRRAIDFPAVAEDGTPLDAAGTLRVEEARTRFYEELSDRQLGNKRTFDSRNYAPFKASTPKSAAEALAIAQIASLIFSLDGIIQAKLKSAMQMQADHGVILTAIRNVLWEHSDARFVQDLSIQLFGTRIEKDPAVNLRSKYDDDSKLQFEYEYLNEIAVALQSDPEGVQMTMLRCAKEARGAIKPADSHAYCPVPLAQASTPDGKTIKISYCSREIIVLHTVYANSPAEKSKSFVSDSTTSIGGFSSPDMDISEIMRGHEILSRILFKTQARGWTIRGRAIADSFSVMNAAYTVEGSAAEDVNKKAKLKLRDFVRKTPSIEIFPGKKPLQEESFAGCTFEELKELADLLITICCRSGRSEKKALGRLLENRLRTYFTIEVPDREGISPSGTSSVPVVIDPSTSIPAGSDAQSFADGRSTRKIEPIPFELPRDETEYSEINFVEVITLAKAGYSKHTLLNKSSTNAEELERKINESKASSSPKNKILVENTAYFVRYILCESGSRTISASLRVRMLAHICARPDMHNLILEGTDTSEEIMLLVLRDIILLHLGVNLQERHRSDSPEGLLFECLSLLISSNLKHALKWRYFSSDKSIGGTIEKTVKWIMTANMGDAGTLIDVLHSTSATDHCAILLQLQAEIRGPRTAESKESGELIYEVMRDNPKTFFMQPKMQQVFLAEGYGVVTMDHWPDLPVFDTLRILTDKAYIRVGDNLYYVCKSTETSLKVDLTEDADKRRKEFDDVLQPNSKFRALGREELKKLKWLTAHLKPKESAGSASVAVSAGPFQAHQAVDRSADGSIVGSTPGGDAWWR